ncbi:MULTISPECIES: ACT domain-containing protein [unclassified Methanopyrus]|uniref:ACT domain-containing protein n=1 Tax=unclassified Methanopyrus TaxID=2684913 RepID=UPI000B4B0197|nr:MULTISPECIES: ACT domain-containing protein [unclassified Methanopyrus]
MTRAVVTVIGADRPGIVAGISSVLAEHNANIEDISQTVLRDLFAMVMLVDLSEADVSVGELRKELQKAGEELGVDVIVQHEDVYRAMHRV